MMELYIMTHRGEKVRLRLKDLGVKSVYVQDKIHVAKTTLYKYFNDPDLSWSVIAQIGRSINYDFRRDFPEMPIDVLQKNESITLIDDDSGEYTEKSAYELRLIATKWKNKYLELLEKYAELLKETSKK